MHSFLDHQENNYYFIDFKIIYKCNHVADIRNSMCVDIF